MSCPWEHDAPLGSWCVTWDIQDEYACARLKLAGAILAMWQPSWSAVPPLMEPVKTVECRCADCKTKK